MLATSAIIGPWRDEIGLISLSGDEQTLIAGEVFVGEGLILGPGQSATFTKTIRVPWGKDGQYLWQVEANSRGDIFEGQNRNNNKGISVAPVNLMLTSLELGGAALPGILSGEYPTYLVKVEIGAGQDIVIDLDNGDDSIKTELYLSRAEVPNLEKYDYCQTEKAGDLSLTFHSPTQSTYYLLVRAIENLNGVQTFNLRAHVITFGLTSSNPNRVGNSGAVLITMHGGGLSASGTYENCRFPWACLSC